MQSEVILRKRDTCQAKFILDSRLRGKDDWVGMHPHHQARSILDSRLRGKDDRCLSGLAIVLIRGG